jgi:hypothetical protein
VPLGLVAAYRRSRLSTGADLLRGAADAHLSGRPSGVFGTSTALAVNAVRRRTASTEDLPEVHK